jgi:UDP-N-acetylglucosamine--dolichyl-phosphate N-acetylglucosaminephosphotransferase
VKERKLFQKAVDYHKPDKPLVPNGLGVIYVLASAVYFFLLYFFDNRNALPLATCILFGGFMGLFDDWVDLKWRYKAFLPLLAAIPLVALRQGTPVMDIPIFGKINFEGTPYIYFYYVLVIPGIVTVTTNTINQLGGLNGLETVCPSIVMLGLLITSRHRILLYVPIVVYAVLAYFNFRGKIFVGNTGSFAIGITLASFAIIANDEKVLLVSILPYIFNSSILLLNRLFLGNRTTSFMKGNLVHAKDRRSLLTLIEYYRPSTERQLVVIASLIIGFFVLLAVLMWLIW